MQQVKYKLTYWFNYLGVVDGLKEDCGEAEGVGAGALSPFPVSVFAGGTYREGHVGVVVGGVLDGDCGLDSMLSK